MFKFFKGEEKIRMKGKLNEKYFRFKQLKSNSFNTDTISIIIGNQEYNLKKGPFGFETNH